MNRKEPVEQSGPGRALSFCTKPKHLKTGLGHMALEKAHPAGASGMGFLERERCPPGALVATPSSVGRRRQVRQGEERTSYQPRSASLVSSKTAFLCADLDHERVTKPLRRVLWGHDWHSISYARRGAKRQRLDRLHTPWPTPQYGESAHRAAQAVDGVAIYRHVQDHHDRQHLADGNRPINHCPLQPLL